MESMEDYGKFRRELNLLLTRGDNLGEEERDFLELLSASDDPRGVIGLATEMQEEGNTLFKEGRFDDALERYGYAGVILDVLNLGRKIDKNSLSWQLVSC